VIRDNKISNNKAEGFIGILLAHDNGDSNANYVGSGDPTNITITGNQVKGNTNGIRIEAGSDIVLNDNDISKSVDNDFYINMQETKPETPVDPGEQEVITPTDDALVDIEKPTTNYGLENPELTEAGTSDKNYFKYFNIKNNSDFSKGRVAFFQFDVANSTDVRNAIFELTGKIGSNTTSVELDVYGLTNDDWSEKTITWENAPNLSSDTVAVTGIGESAILLGSITIDASEAEKLTLDVTDFVKAQSDGKITLMAVDTKGQSGNVNIYSKEESNDSRWPALIIGK
jgi:parallel beta-helix repeat protein